MNLLPSSIVETFNLGKIKPTSMTLEFADRSFKHPKGLLEDVIVTVQEHRFPVDFVVLDVEFGGKMNEIPIILGRTFLEIARALKDYENGTIEFRVNNEKFFVETKQLRKVIDFEEIDSIEECWTIKKLEIEEGMKMITKDKMELVLNTLNESLDDNVQELCQQLNSSELESDTKQPSHEVLNLENLDESGVMPLMDSQIENLVTIDNFKFDDEEHEVETLIELKPLP